MNRRRFNHYRVVTDKYSDYEAQVWRPLWPFWCQIGFNTNSTPAGAEKVCRDHANPPPRVPFHRRVVKDLGRLAR
jgi:hypothetical protein